MILIDTDVLSMAYYGPSNLGARVDAARDAVELQVPAIVKIEMMHGRASAILKAGTADLLMQMWHRFGSTADYLSKFTTCDFDHESAQQFGRLKAMKKLGKVGNADLQIAALALVRAAVLVTRNDRDFKLVPGLRIENWAKT